jgi:outer membrane cobalamin receptor
VVAPVTDGSLSFADPVVVASTDATVTGRKFEYVWADEQLEDLVITASRTAAVTEDAGAEPDVLQRLDRIEDAVGNLTAAVQDYIQSQVDAALAEV